MQIGQEWRTENSNRYFPFTEGSSIPRGFISDLKFTHQRRGVEEIVLDSITDLGDSYGLSFKFVSDGAVAISGEVKKNHGLKQVCLWGENNESVIIFSTGDTWDNPPTELYESRGQLDNSVVSSGPSMIRRVVIVGETNDESTWRKESIQSLKGGTNVDLLLAKNYFAAPPGQNTNNDFIEIAAVYGGGDGPPDYLPDSGIKTINQVTPEKGNIQINGIDCIHTQPKTYGQDYDLKIKSDCLPSCGCSSYQLISDAITYRSARLSELCKKVNDMLASSVQLYNAAVLALAQSERVVARIRAVRVYGNTIKMALQNVCALPIYGTYGVTIYGASFSNASPPNVIPASLPAPAKYNSHVNADAGDIPLGTFRGTIGPINPGSYVDLEFVSSHEYTPDLRGMDLTIDAQSNGYFGTLPMLGCKKDVYSVSVSPDESLSSCNDSTESIRYKITEAQEAP